MTREIVIRSGEAEWRATLGDGPTADALWEALPIEGRANTWSGMRK